MTKLFQVGDFLVWGLLAVLIASLFLASCGHYQPPGEDLWRTFR